MKAGKISSLLRFLTIVCLLALMVSGHAERAQSEQLDYDQDGDVVMMDADGDNDDAGLLVDLNKAAKEGELSLHL